MNLAQIVTPNGLIDKDAWCARLLPAERSPRALACVTVRQWNAKRQQHTVLHEGPVLPGAGSLHMIAELCCPSSGLQGEED
jgi:hypothetical protein